MDVPQFVAGRFRIEREIGKGGMGTVYRASHLGLQRSVAVKIIKSEFAGDPDVADRFMREARTMARLRHPRAAMIFDAGNLPDGRHFIIMEFIEGVTLADALAQEGRFSIERAIAIALQICDVLEEAHQLGIIHRDLKPSNIMLNERGACVLDFGVAKVLASSVESSTTQAISTGSGQIVGTPRYMSPEQCLGQRVGVRSDLYGLGVLLYEMLAGRPPFIDGLASVLLVKQATALPPPLPRLRQDIPRSLSLVVHTLLAKRPEDRPQTAAVVRLMLQRCLTHSEPATPREVEPLSSTVALSHSRNIAMRIGGPLVLVGVLGGLLLVLAYGGPAAETAATQARTSLSASLQPETPAPKATATASQEPVRMLQGIGDRSSPASLSLAQARRIASSLAHGPVGDVVVMQSPEGPTIFAIHEDKQKDRQTVATSFFVARRTSGRYRIIDRGPLDVPEFRARKWKAETIDANGDGQTQVLFSGSHKEGQQQNAGTRLVLYDLPLRQAYGLRVEADSLTGRIRRMYWSSNFAQADSGYRVALRDKARALLSATTRT